MVKLLFQVQSLRKRMVKKALALMEDIDTVKSSMLHSILVHADDDQSEFSEPFSGPISEASEPAEEDHLKHESEGGAPAVAVEAAPMAIDPELQQVADALAGFEVADEEAQSQMVHQGKECPRQALQIASQVQAMKIL